MIHIYAFPDRMIPEWQSEPSLGDQASRLMSLILDDFTLEDSRRALQSPLASSLFVRAKNDDTSGQVIYVDAPNLHPEHPAMLVRSDLIPEIVQHWEKVAAAYEQAGQLPLPLDSLLVAFLRRAISKGYAVLILSTLMTQDYE